ncbi:hypothetical protein ID866_7461 [Astraeus odoratus]|nr:hypothetical protein ID866_7461 [Astraeus odoratus]
MPMLDINHPRMLQPTPSSPASLDPSPLHNMLALDHAKVSPGHLYVCQPNAIQIIQLVEGPPPPPRRISSVLGSTAAGSSYPSTSDSEEGSEQCSSYCSSIVTPDESSKEHEPAPWTDETYSIRMRRVRAWRDAAHDASSSPPLKRRMTSLPNDDDHVCAIPYPKTIMLGRAAYVQIEWIPVLCM